MADRIIQRPLYCRIAHCGASCDRITVEQMECLYKDVTKCPYYERRDDLYEKDFTEEVLNKIRTEILNDWQIKEMPSSPFSCGLRYAVEIIDKYMK